MLSIEPRRDLDDGGAGDYAGKPRPAVIIQADEFSALDSVTVCPFTTNEIDAIFRPLVQPDAENGLTASSRLMADKLMTVKRIRLGTRIGVLNPETLNELQSAIAVFLGFAVARAEPE